MQNNIYSLLVNDQDDLIGLVAYGLYKRHKIEFIENLPSEMDKEANMQAFYLSSSTPSQLDKYRNEAERLLYDIVLNSAQEQVSSAQKDLLDSNQKALKEYTDSIDIKIGDSVKKNLPKLGENVLTNIIGAVACALITALFMFIGSITYNRIFNAMGEAADMVHRTIPKGYSPADTNTYHMK